MRRSLRWQRSDQLSRARASCHEQTLGLFRLSGTIDFERWKRALATGDKHFNGTSSNDFYNHFWRQRSQGASVVVSCTVVPGESVEAFAQSRPRRDGLARTLSLTIGRVEVRSFFACAFSAWLSRDTAHPCV